MSLFADNNTREHVSKPYSMVGVGLTPSRVLIFSHLILNNSIRQVLYYPTFTDE